MNALWYLYRRTARNRVKTALHKPITYVYIACCILYVTAIPGSLQMFLSKGNLDSPVGIAGVLTLLAFWMIPGNLIAYTRRKGLVFRNSDIHFLFPSPIDPKQILVYTYVKTLLMKMFLILFVIAFGVIAFHVQLWKMLLYAVFSLIMENTLEGCVMLLLYGSEKLQERQQKCLITGAYGLVGVLLLIAIYYYFRMGLGIEMLVQFITGDTVKMVPVIGWYISVIHLIFIGPSTVNLAGAACYLVLLTGLVIAALRMNCTGAYYEEAIQFSDDYEELLQSRKQGNMEKKLGKKQKFQKASVKWKGNGAKALFYRQLLEYKKRRLFILDKTMVLYAVVGVVIAWLYIREDGFGDFSPYVIPIVSAYLIFIFTNFNGKWGNEIKAPYTYLIPDSPFRKLWNATSIQIVQSLLYGLFITLPGAIVMKMNPLTALLIVIGYTILAANKLYALAVAEIVTGNVLGNVGKQLLQLFLQGIVIVLAVVGAMLGYYVGGVLLSFILLDVFIFLATVVFMVIASLNFYRMEI